MDKPIIFSDLPAGHNRSSPKPCIQYNINALQQQWQQFQQRLG
ncbi:hypothetical protein [Dickeya zeae]|nr:hypothetical protein [Dickeya zeae]